MIETSTGVEKTVVKPNSRFLLWCPFCDDWKSIDSMIARKRLGQHLANKHTDEVRFARGKTPPALENI